MSRNLYILAATMAFFSVVSYVVGFSGIAREPGSPADQSLWHMIGIVLLLLALIVALFGVLQSMFEQAERRSERMRQQERMKRQGRQRSGPERP